MPPVHDYVIANGTGASVRSDLNDALAAIVSNNSSSSEPATTYAYQWWADTTANVLKIRNSANNAWITLRELDGTLLMEDGSVSAPGLSFASDTNTGFFSGGADKIGFATGGAERLEIGSSEVVFNDPSNDVDFRVESNGNTHMLFVDAGNDRVGIGSSSPSFPLTVQADSGTNGIAVLGRSADDISSALFYENDGTTQIGRLQARQSYFQISGTNNSKGIFIDNAGEVGIAKSSPGEQLDVNGKVRSDDSSDSRFLLRVNNVNKGGFQATTDAGVVIYGASSTNPIRFQTSGSERMRIDSSGRLLIGTSTSEAFNGIGGALQIEGTSNATTRMSLFRTQNDAAASVLVFAKARNTSHAVLSNNDEIGKIEFYGADGNDTNQRAGMILCAVDGTAGSNDMPGRLVFFTTADGASSPTERLRIDSSGNIGMTTAGFFGFNGVGDETHSIQYDSGIDGVQIRGQNGIKFATGSGSGSERLRIDSSGRLLVGTTSTNAGSQESTQIVGSAVMHSTGLRSLSSGGTLDLSSIGTSITGHLYVTSTLISNALVRTHKTFFIATRQGNSTAITELNGDNGSSGGRNFTITNPSANILRFTDTSSSACSVSMSFIGTLGF